MHPRSTEEKPISLNSLDSKDNASLDRFRNDFIAGYIKAAKTTFGDKDYNAILFPSRAKELSDDFYLLVQKGTFPADCLIPRGYTNGNTTYRFNPGLELWAKYILRFHTVFRADQSKHAALNLLNDEKYGERACAYILEGHTWHSKKSFLINAFPFYDPELGKLVFSDNNNCEYYKQMCELQTKYNLGETPEAVRITFQKIIHEMHEGKSFSQALEKSATPDRGCVIS